MGEVVNLRRVRKGKAREDRAEKAEANRAKFGRSKSEKTLADASRTLGEKRLDAHLRDVKGRDD